MDAGVDADYTDVQCGWANASLDTVVLGMSGICHSICKDPERAHM